MLEIMDYFIIGYLIILCLCSAYLRRDNENKVKSALSFSYLICACLSIIAYFLMYNLIENYRKYLIHYLIVSILIFSISTIIIVLKLRKTQEVNDEK